MNYKAIISQIQERQLTTFCSLTDFTSKRHLDILPRKHRGLYWLWCNSSYDDLETIITRPNTKEVPISKLVKARKGLNNICNIKIENSIIVYNGIGGYEREPAKFGLRERILQELSSSNIETGSLNLTNRFNENTAINNWSVSFFDFDNVNNLELLNTLTFDRNWYLDHANSLEISWRIEYGTPILTRY